MKKLYDKKGREIMVGDVVKIYHYRAALRRQKCYMYKWVLRVEKSGDYRYMHFSHLSHGSREGFVMPMNGDIKHDWEIVQGFGPDDTYQPFDDRPSILKQRKEPK